MPRGDRTPAGRVRKFHRTPETLAAAEEAQRVIAENVRELRQARGWSYHEVYRRSGVAATTVWKLENRGGTDFRTVAILASFFGVPLSQLVEPLWRRQMRSNGHQGRL